MEEMLAAYQAAIDYTAGPSMIIAKMVKGKGVSFLEDQNGRHGKPVTGEEFDRALKEIGDLRLEESLSVAIPTISDSDAVRATPAVGEIDPPRYEKGEQVPTRKAYVAGLSKLGKVNPRIIALDAALKNSTYTEDFLKEIPARFIECYVADQNMIGMAHGLSALEKIPFCSTFASFLSRAYDQIRMASVSDANIKYAGSHAGVAIGEDGPSQMGLEDLAMFRAVHDSTILYPADAVATEHMGALAAQHARMVYLRLMRPKTPILYSAADTFAIGGSHTLRLSAGDEVAIIAAGITVYEALTAARLLEKERIVARVIDAYSIKPLDAKTVHQAVEETGAVLTVEDHNPEGRLGDAVLNVLAGRSISTYKLAVYNMPRSGDPETLMNHYDIGASSIVAAVKEMLGGD